MVLGSFLRTLALGLYCETLVTFAYTIIYHRQILVDNYTTLLSLSSFPDTLVLARYLGILSDIVEILGSLLLWRFVLTCLQYG